MKNKIILLLGLLSLSLGLFGFSFEDASKTAPLINVSVSGFVRNPGSYKVPMGETLIGVFKLANQNLEVPKLEMQEPLVPRKLIPIMREEQEEADKYEVYQSLRNVVVHSGKDENSYDLLAYLRKGDGTQNPVMKDGDMVFVDVVKDFVGVYGSVAIPGNIEYKEGESIRELIALAGGILPGSELSKVQHGVYQGSGKPYLGRDLDLLNDPAAYDEVLGAGDRLMIPYDTLYRARTAVILTGQFARQGEFLLAQGSGVWEAIQSSGGILDDADLDNAVVINRSYSIEPDYEFERILQTPPTSLTPLEMSYWRTRLRQLKGRYALDFKQIVESEGEEGDIALCDGDIIFIPKKLDMVYVSGQVRNPGFIAYQKGEDYRYYIEKAGGFVSNRKKFGGSVIKADTGNWVRLSDRLDILPGDTIFIPEKTGYSIWPDVRDAITVMASAVSIIVGINNLRK